MRFVLLLLSLVLSLSLSLSLSPPLSLFLSLSLALSRSLALSLARYFSLFSLSFFQRRWWRFLSSGSSTGCPFYHTSTQKQERHCL